MPFGRKGVDIRNNHKKLNKIMYIKTLNDEIS